MQKQKERERKKNKKLYIVAYKPKDLNSSSHKKGHADNEHSGKRHSQPLHSGKWFYFYEAKDSNTKHATTAF